MAKLLNKLYLKLFFYPETKLEKIGIVVIKL